MTPFTDQERAYLAEPRLGRLATVDAQGRPHVVPTGFRFDPAAGVIDIGGHDLARTKKFGDARANPRWRSWSTTASCAAPIASTAPNGDGSETRPGAPPVHRPVTCGTLLRDPLRRDCL